MSSSWYRKTINLMEGINQSPEGLFLNDSNPLFWRGTHPKMKQYEELNALLVPSMGVADTLAGEVLRCVSRIYYRHFNDGDVYDRSTLGFIFKHLADSFSTYDELAERAIEFAADPKNQQRPNTIDEFSQMKVYDDYDDEDDGYDPYALEDDDDDDENFL